MKLSKLSNQTNSQDPQAVNSRIFVGNLNTFQCSKTDVERMFQIYGRLAGISMHKGYAFVQFTNPFDARNACHGEDGRTVLSQTLDVNMVAEPKAHQIGRKRQNVTKTGNDWDYFYDSYCSSTLLRSSGVRPKKRKRLQMGSTSRLLTDAVCGGGNINAAVAAAAAAQQQQHLHQHQQQQQHQHHHHHQTQQQQQVAAVAMAAMANLLPQQQQLLLHQQSLLGNANGAAATCNGNTTTPHHSLNVFLQQQQIKQQQHQQQHQQHQQQQQQQAGQYAAAAAAAVAAASLQLKASPVQNASSAIIAAANQTTLSNGEQLSTTHTTTTAAFGCANNTTTHIHHQQQHHQQQQGQHASAMQPLTLTLPPPPMPQQQQAQQQQQQQQYYHHQQQQMLQLQQQQEQLTSGQQWGPFKVYSNPDTLICGNCRECFNELAELLDHKRSYCKLRFTCKCQEAAVTANTLPSSAKLLCAVCKDAFANPWDLMVHAQSAHMVNIYELGNEANNNNANCGDAVIAANVETAATGNACSAAAAKDSQAASMFSKQQHCNSESNGNGNGKGSSNGNRSNNSNNDNNNNNSHNNTQLSPTTTQSALESIGNFDMALAGVGGAVASSVAAGGGSCNNSITGDGNVSDSETQCLDIKFAVCSSPNGSLAKEDAHRDDASLDGRMSISSNTHHSDDLKLQNGSASSRGSSPALDAEEQQPRACIVRTLSFEATTANATNTAAALGIMSNSLALSLTNGATNVAAAIVPQ